MKKHTYHTVLTIAGADSSGGAGIQADLKTFAALGCYGMSVITSLTAQNTVGIMSVLDVPARFVAKQIDAVFNDIGVDAVKIGMVKNEEIIRIISRKLRSYRPSRIIVDPVMIAKDGKRLLRQDAIHALTTQLFPLATIVTPNIPEAVFLTGCVIRNKNDVEKAGVRLLSYGPEAVLLKGGHTKNNICQDCLCIAGANGKISIKWMGKRRIQTKNTHGTGCTLSSAIAAYLARGYGILEAVEQSKQYITGAIKAGAAYRLGKGHGPVHHFYKGVVNQDLERATS